VSELITVTGRGAYRRHLYVAPQCLQALASRRPLWWLNPTMIDLGLCAMAPGLRTGELLTKADATNPADAIEQTGAY
jgi:hypothetical protein